MIDRRMLWAATLEDLGRRCSVDTALDAEYVERRVAAEGEEFFTTTLPQFGKDLERSLEDRAIGWDLFMGFKRRKRPVTTSDWIQSSEGGYTETASKMIPHGVPQFLQGFMLQIFDDSYDVTSREFKSYEDAVAHINAREVAVQALSGGVHYTTIGEIMVPLALPRSGVDSQDLRIADAIAAIRQLCLMFGKEKSVCSDLRVEQAVGDYVTTDKELMDPFTMEG